MINTNIGLLRLPCKQVDTNNSKELLAIKLALEQELNACNNSGLQAIGISSPQICIYQKYSIVRIPQSQFGPAVNIDLVNAEIIKKYDSFISRKESCLSFKGIEVDVPRNGEILVKNDVEPRLFIASGLPAICIQHELDHTFGILIIDYLPKNNSTKSNKKRK